MDLSLFFRDLTLYGLEKLGLYYSQYRGFVYDNVDPQGYGRLQLSVPEVHGDMILNHWAWPANMFSGKNYGVQCLPQKNDLVWVTFEKGNPRKPLWSYGYFGKDDIPENLKGPNLIWFVTPKQNKVIINDTDGTITILSNTGKAVEIKDTIHLGEPGSSTKPIAFGDTTKNKLENLIDILSAGKVMTALGPQPFMPDTQLQLTQLKETLDEIPSTITHSQ